MRPLQALCLVGGLVLLGSVGCTSRNAMGRRQISLLPDSVLNSQASTLFDQEKQEKALSQNQRQKALLQQVGDRLIAQAKTHYGQYCEGFQWEIELFEAPETLNAYCMPGGKIGFYTGILPVCKTEAGVAVVMGHEIAHALLKHGNARATAQMGLSALQAGAGALLDSKSSVSDVNKKAILSAVGLGAQYGVLLPNSRVDENEADHMGILLMAYAGYDPSEAPRLWTRMGELNKGGTPEFSSTHPSDERRVRRLTEFLPEAQPLYQASASKWGLGANF